MIIKPGILVNVSLARLIWFFIPFFGKKSFTNRLL